MAAQLGELLEEDSPYFEDRQRVTMDVYVVGGDYVGEHWLASFAVLALSAAALKSP